MSIGPGGYLRGKHTEQCESGVCDGCVGATKERPLTKDDFEAACVDSGMVGVSGTVVEGPKRTVYVARCGKSRWFRAGWWVQAGLIQETVRSEAEGLKKARRWATVGFPSEE